jgi:hypothetical protein
MVWLAHKGDVIVHYRSSPRLAVVALSRAATDARSGKVPLRGYGRGWYFETEYFKLKNPIRREAFLQRLRPLEIEYGPVLSNGRVREGYFMPFSGLGLSCLQELSRDEWPRWARQAARQR